MRTLLFLASSLLLLSGGCSKNAIKPKYEAKTYDFPKPVDTEDHEIEIQKKQVYSTDGVFASNNFSGARLNGFDQVNDTLYQALISPENIPINSSPWYAFKVWSQEEQSIYIELDYSIAKHRYHPKISTDGKEWNALNKELVSYSVDSTNATLKLEVSTDTVWVAAQEIMNSHLVQNWSRGLTSDSRVHYSEIGKSKLGKPLAFIDIYEGEKGSKETIVLLSRQHPPEVTGFMAMQSFVEELLSNSRSEEFLKRYRIMIYPLLNPDGVDMGHWRHSAGGVDLNRDWAYYHQSETRQVADHIVNETRTHNNEVILGLDFHSTWHDVYYTFARENGLSNIPGFRAQWFELIEVTLGDGYKINEKPSGLGDPVTKGWFYTQFGAEGITYEIGDSTPREFIRQKGKVSAAAMIDVLLEGEYR